MKQAILQHKALQRLIKKTFSREDVEILERPKSIILKKKEESLDVVFRIILLSPHGYSSNKLEELSSHNEVRKAKINIKGAIKEGKNNFSTIKNCLKLSYLRTRDAITEGSVPYAMVQDNLDLYKEKILSSKESVFVVKENGEGFYHNLVNTSDDWLVLFLEKELRSGKKMDIASQIINFTTSEKKIINELMAGIDKYGDNLFNAKPELVKSILKFETGKILPVLIEALNIYETGRHEPCTVYALILNKAKVDRIGTLKFLHNSLGSNKSPDYYLKELILKINKK